MKAKTFIDVEWLHPVHLTLTRNSVLPSGMLILEYAVEATRSSRRR